MYYIHCPKEKKVLTTSLTWRAVKDLKKNPVFFEDLLFFKGSHEAAQSFCMWFIEDNPVVPYKPAKMETFYKGEISFPDDLPDHYRQNIADGTYPRCLLRQPVNRDERTMFQMALRKGLNSLANELAILNGASPIQFDHNESASFFLPEEVASGVYTEPDEAGLDSAVPEAPPASFEEGVLYEDEENLAANEVDESQLSLDAEPQEKEPAYKWEDPLRFRAPIESRLELTPIIEDMNDLVQAINRVKRGIADIHRERRDAMTQADLRLEDLLHLVEMSGDMTVTDSYRLLKAIREARLERRAAKDDLCVVSKVSAMLANIKTQEIQEILNSINTLSQRHYTARVMKGEELEKLIKNNKTLASLSS